LPPVREIFGEADQFGAGVARTPAGKDAGMPGRPQQLDRLCDVGGCVTRGGAGG